MNRPSLADRVRSLLQKSKPGYGKVDTDESIEIVNRAQARRYIRSRGPWLHLPASRNETRTRTPGRSRRKREAARQRAKAGTR